MAFVSTPHNFITTVEEVTVRVNGEFDSDGEYDVEEVLFGDVDIHNLLSNDIIKYIREEAFRTIVKDAEVIQMERKIHNGFAG